MSDNEAGRIPEVTLGWRLRMSLERAGLKADYMADVLDVHRGTITRWTHDIGSPPRAIYLRTWAEMCEVPFGWLAGELAVEKRPRVGAHNRRVTSPSTSGCVTTTRHATPSRAVSCSQIAA